MTDSSTWPWSQRRRHSRTLPVGHWVGQGGGHRCSGNCCLVDAECWLILAVFALTVGGGAWVWPGDAVGGRGTQVAAQRVTAGSADEYVATRIHARRSSCGCPLHDPPVGVGEMLGVPTCQIVVQRVDVFVHLAGSEVVRQQARTVTAGVVGPCAHDSDSISRTNPSTLPTIEVSVNSIARSAPAGVNFVRAARRRRCTAGRPRWDRFGCSKNITLSIRGTVKHV